MHKTKPLLYEDKIDQFIAQLQGATAVFNSYLLLSQNLSLVERLSPTLKQLLLFAEKGLVETDQEIGRIRLALVEHVLYTPNVDIEEKIELLLDYIVFPPTGKEDT